MYCPNCASQNGDDAKFCRTCGANLSLVPQALTGKIPDGRRERHRRRRSRREKSPDYSYGIAKAFTGFGFISIAIILVLFGHFWGVWMLIPGFGALGKGVAEIIARREAKQIAGSLPVTAARAPNTGSLSAANSPELMAPPASVTEGTTKLFDEADRGRP